jgi:CRP-like cAMP-binding protein
MARGRNIGSSQPTPGKLSPDLLQALHGIKSVRLFPTGAKLFQQGVVATGVYLVESAEVRVLLPTGQSQKQLLEVVGPGTMLGLSESMSGERYRITAEAGEQTAAAFDPREQFLGFLREHGDLHGGGAALERRLARALPQIPQHQRSSGASAEPASG